MSDKGNHARHIAWKARLAFYAERLRLTRRKARKLRKLAARG